MSYPFAKLQQAVAFAARAHQGQLRKDGRKIKLQEQPFQVLIGLVEAWFQALRTVGVELVAVHLLLVKPTKAPTRG